MEVGRVKRVAGPVVQAVGLKASMYDLVLVGEEGLMSEVIGISGDKHIIQVYEDTSGIKPGEPVKETGGPLVAQLGPGILTQIYDGVQRPLPLLAEKSGDFISRGLFVDGVDHKKKWEFKPLVKKGDTVKPGQPIGEVQEQLLIKHKIMVPPKHKGGVVKEIYSGNFTVEETVCVLEDGSELTMLQKWPVRQARPVVRKLPPTIPLRTGQRVIDGFFPLAKGGTAAIPGGFGTGKTVMQQTLSKWSDVDIVIYVGCGERGNEMADLLHEFPELVDPRTNRPLLERSIVYANTSNMPVAAREASIYTGMTTAEYYRDMGYDVLMTADSTSRWAEAMRELASRLEEMPGEEGYPAYLAARLADFYERAGRAEVLAGGEGSVAVVGAVSPPGGDFTEPVTQNTLRIVKVFWALDSRLTQRRHFPSINWLDSYSLYEKDLESWYAENVAPDWNQLKRRAMAILQENAELEEIVMLVGSDALPEDQQLTLEVARMIINFWLAQSAFHPVDTFCPYKKQYDLLKAILTYRDYAFDALRRGVAVDQIKSVPSKDALAKLRMVEDYEPDLKKVMDQMKAEFEALK
ncbi:MAG: V-type ATP synthase subunit A [Methanothrix sp.]|uniref:A-type ATP synthase subunit A n=1 Tax=Methanothrix thermoacetophila (strain DSM 6194 / JCM 14653 / NBRC 101360 / PT) TaxID=349307 RepID=AATA_METTP|nr:MULTISPECIES: V-type ATP synthase subunit A [Methanothrix]A0B9K2.1 RecName: Full=V-type ATP synthase alpha chain; AltName: Full=V-ATPase subunit A [Methanothrix thermoacetophila PT]ABK15376.1 Sodium-transporting two-sector ATPase [Methanothrix thermoacetophila PT]MBC7080078.1 V-type ATP synthase subunit A [Methanothrix sp.]NPU88308.1 V-type ATP synthase subunit A [Methanothrix sp.]